LSFYTLASFPYINCVKGSWCEITITGQLKIRQEVEINPVMIKLVHEEVALIDQNLWYLRTYCIHIYHVSLFRRNCEMSCYFTSFAGGCQMLQERKLQWSKSVWTWGGAVGWMRLAIRVWVACDDMWVVRLAEFPFGVVYVWVWCWGPSTVCCYLLTLARCLHHPVFATWSRGVYCVGMSTVSPVRPPSWLLTCHASSINLLFYFWRSCLVHGSHPSQMCGQTTGNDALWLIVSFFQEYINSAHWKSTPPFKILTFCWLVAWN